MPSSDHTPSLHNNPGSDHVPPTLSEDLSAHPEPIDETRTSGDNQRTPRPTVRFAVSDTSSEVDLSDAMSYSAHNGQDVSHHVEPAVMNVSKTTPHPNPLEPPGTLPVVGKATSQRSTDSGSGTGNSEITLDGGGEDREDDKYKVYDRERFTPYAVLEARIRDLESRGYDRPRPPRPSALQQGFAALLGTMVEFEEDEGDDHDDADEVCRAHQRPHAPHGHARPDPRRMESFSSQHERAMASISTPARSYSQSTVSSTLSEGSVDAFDEHHPTARAAKHVNGGVNEETLQKFAIDRDKYDKMTHKQRIKYIQEFVTMNFDREGMSLKDREKLLLKLGRALVYLGAPSHRVEQLLSSIAAHYKIACNFVLFPGLLVFSIDRDAETSEAHFLRIKGGVQLTYLHRLHEIYRKLAHGDMTAKEGCRRIQELLKAPPLFGNTTQLILAFMSSALVCLVGFDGSFLDAIVSGMSGVVLASVRAWMGKSDVFANLFEVIMAVLVSLVARGLSAIHSNSVHFCYTSVMSASIVSLLPGFLALSASLELASKNMICGSVKMVYGLIYVLLLGFCLTLGSDIFLAFDPVDRTALANAVGGNAVVDTVYGSFQSDNGTTPVNLTGIWTFTTTYANSSLNQGSDQVAGCYRPGHSPWYLQPISFKLTLGLIPLFALSTSVGCGQACWPLVYRSKSGRWSLHSNVRELLVMVTIAIVGYITNYTANTRWASHSDIVSAYGALVIGALGNLYSRLFRGTAFTAMVPGVLLLVPSGLAAAGGVTSTNAFDIGVKMLAVVIGITTGLFLSTAAIYIFGQRKKGAIMAF